MTTWKPAHNPKTLQATRLVAAMLFAVGVIVAVGVIRTLLRSTPPDISSTSNNISSVVRDNSGKIFVDHQVSKSVASLQTAAIQKLGGMAR